MPSRSTTPAEASPVVTVWWAHRSLAGELDLAILSEGERQRVSRLRREADRDRSAVARGVLRLALASHLPEDAADLAIDWSRGPVLPGSLATWASVTHSDDAVGVAISTVGPIGIDVEALRRTKNLSASVQQAVFTTDERDELAALPGTERLSTALRLWTLKEAILKATGDGLVRAPATVSMGDIAGRVSLRRFDEREDLVGSAQLFGLSPTARPHGEPVEGDPERAHVAPGPAGYVASLAVLSSTPLRLVERDAAELLA